MAAPEPARGARVGSRLFALVIGALVGVLASNLVAPRSPTIVIDGAAGAAPSQPSQPSGSADSPATPGASVTGPQGSGPAAGLPGGGTGDAAGTGASAPDAAAGAEANDPAPGTDPATSAPGEDDDDTAPDQPAATGGATARGVTADTVKVGVGVLDIGALRHLGPSFDNGDGHEHMRAWLEGVRRDGLLPIHGRDLDVVYHSYPPAQIDSAGAQRSTCTAFVDDHKVFAVLAGSNFQLGSECVAREKRTPLVTSDGVRDEVYGRSDPFLFTFQMSTSRLLRNWLHWAHHSQILPGKTIGMYWQPIPEMEELNRTVIRPTLAELGYEIASEHTTDQPLGGPQDAVAVQKFRTEGVDLVLLFTSKAGFQQNAERQDYHPTYIDTDFNQGTSNTATSTYPPEQWDGTLGMAGFRWGEWDSGIPQSEPARKCVDYYEQHSGRRIDPGEREAEWVGMNKMCDTGWALLEALRAAGPNLTHQTFVAGMETFDGVDLGAHLPVSFQQGKHHGAELQRTVQWHADCTCWKVAGELGPLWVP